MRFGFLLALLVLSSCTSRGPQAVWEPLHRPTSIVTSSTGFDVNTTPDREVVTEVIRAAPDVAWLALLTAYEEFGIPIKEMNEDLRIVGNPHYVVSRRLNGTRLSRYLDCGQGPAGDHADLFRIEMQIRTSILEIPSGVRLNTHIAAIARNMDGTSNTRIRCASKFRLEREMAGRVKLYAEGK